MAGHTLFLVFREPGPAWVKALPTREQPLWDEHAAFMDRLFDEGRIVLAGPYGDEGKALVVMNLRDAREEKELFRGDPWVKAGILVSAGVIRWTIFLDSRVTPVKTGGR